jgi:hypothetical protein
MPEFDLYDLGVIEGRPETEEDGYGFAGISRSLAEVKQLLSRRPTPSSAINDQTLRGGNDRNLR